MPRLLRHSPLRSVKENMKFTVLAFAFHLLLFSSCFSGLNAEEETESLTGKDLEFVTGHGSVKNDGLIRYAKGMTLFEVTELSKPGRLWNGYITIIPAGSEDKLTYRFRPRDGNLMKKTMMRVMVYPDDQIYFLENVD